MIKKNGIYFEVSTAGLSFQDKFYVFTYEYIVDKIIRAKYSASQVEAIINNYLSDMKNKERLKEFDELQAWRNEAKDAAKKVSNFIQKSDLINKPDGVYEIK